jgi:hypothetical protein
MLSFWSSLQDFFFLFGQVSSAESKRRSNRSLEHFGTGSYNPHMTKAAALGFHQESEWDSQLGENTWLKKKS